MKNLTDFRKTVETSVNQRLFGNPPSIRRANGATGVHRLRKT